MHKPSTEKMNCNYFHLGASEVNSITSGWAACAMDLTYRVYDAKNAVLIVVAWSQ